MLLFELLEERLAHGPWFVVVLKFAAVVVVMPVVSAEDTEY